MDPRVTWLSEVSKHDQESGWLQQITGGRLVAIVVLTIVAGVLTDMLAY